MSKLILAHAVGDENGQAKGGKAGDQTGKEVRFQDYYDRSKGWTDVFRAKDEAKREIIAQCAVDAVTNDKIGYDQGQRLTLYDEAEKVKFNVIEIEKACETDCSALATVCLAAAGIKIDKSTYTGNMKENIKTTGLMKDYTADKYLHSTQYLQEGDILLGPGHAAIVVDESRKATPKKSSIKKNVRVQIGAFYNPATADLFLSQVKKAGFPSAYIVEEGGYKKVIAGLYATTEEAYKAARILNQRCFATYVYKIKGGLER